MNIFAITKKAMDKYEPEDIVNWLYCTDGAMETIIKFSRTMEQRAFQPSNMAVVHSIDDEALANADEDVLRIVSFGNFKLRFPDKVKDLLFIYEEFGRVIETTDLGALVLLKKLGGERYNQYLTKHQ